MFILCKETNFVLVLSLRWQKQDLAIIKLEWENIQSANFKTEVSYWDLSK